MGIKVAISTRNLHADDEVGSEGTRDGTRDGDVDGAADGPRDGARNGSREGTSHVVCVIDADVILLTEEYTSTEVMGSTVVKRSSTPGSRSIEFRGSEVT